MKNLKRLFFNTKVRSFIISALGLAIFSCQSYKQHILFRYEPENITGIMSKAEKSYKIRSADLLDVKVYTNKGELLIDPNLKLSKEIGASGQQQKGVDKPKYVVNSEGFVNLPMVGKVDVEGLTVTECDSMLSERYQEYYHEVFVITRVDNKRVTVIGPKGGQVIPLENEKMNLIEVIAFYKGLDTDFKSHNIRLIRGDLDDPEVAIINLSTIDGMKEAQLSMQPNDVVYIEPVRRVFSESIRDISPIISLATSLVAIIAIFTR